MATTEFIWDMQNDNYLMEQDGVGATTAVYTNEPAMFGELVSQDRAGSSSYYHFDGQGSTRALTDEHELATDAATYNAFGELVTPPGSTRNPFGYNGSVGYYVNADTVDHYVRARYYASYAGRWRSADPLSLDGPNYYHYVNNNPLSQSDPSGLISLAASSIPTSFPDIPPGNVLCQSVLNCSDFKKWDSTLCQQEFSEDNCECSDTQEGRKGGRPACEKALADAVDLLKPLLCPKIEIGRFVCSSNCGAPRFAVTCHLDLPSGVRRIAMCMPLTLTGCQLSRLIEHEFVHVRQHVLHKCQNQPDPASRPRATVERPAYEAQCQLAAAHKCKSGDKKFIEDCVKDLIGGSLDPINMTPLEQRCKLLL